MELGSDQSEFQRLTGRRGRRCHFTMLHAVVALISLQLAITVITIAVAISELSSLHKLRVFVSDVLTDVGETLPMVEQLLPELNNTLLDMSIGLDILKSLCRAEPGCQLPP